MEYREQLGHDYRNKMAHCPNCGFYMLPKLDKNGKPVFDANNDPIIDIQPSWGWGMMQLTAIGNTGRPPTSNEIWNWKANIDAGMTTLDEKKKAAIGDFAEHPTNQEALIPMFGFTALELDMITRYNSGTYWRYDDSPAISKWVRTGRIKYVQDIRNKLKQ